jgi:hypothetical protein
MCRLHETVEIEVETNGALRGSQHRAIRILNH